ncbi:MAG TPA: molybdopterin cofactor-binding domain-containing protein, partial [Tetragenococcus sp.]|nr:molybdopterin cofactor-binding domain-containing protein [Tetragenococcus sp.]
ESMIDDAAEKIGMDPIEFRLKNCRKNNFYNTISNIRQFDFNVDKCLQEGRQAFAWDDKLAASKNYKSGNKRRGVGVAAFSYGSGTYPFGGLEAAGARMILMPDGSVKLMLGATEIGQGADTAFAQMAAETIGIPYDWIIRDAMTDTDIDPFDTGAYASRQTYIAGFAVQEAADKMRTEILERAAQTYDIRVEQLDLVDGKIVYLHNQEKIAELADLALDSFYSLSSSKAIVTESSVNIHENSYASGCTFAEVEVDIETGRITLLDVMNVHDSGRIINPLLAQGQVDGGMAMGIAYGLSEGIFYDKNGRPLNTDLLDYKIPTTMDLPDLKQKFVESEDPVGPYGNKSLGENPLCSPAAAIRNAVKNAVGLGINTNPLSPQHVYEELQKANIRN